MLTGGGGGRTRDTRAAQINSKKNIDRDSRNGNTAVSWPTHCPLLAPTQMGKHTLYKALASTPHPWTTNSTLPKSTSTLRTEEQHKLGHQRSTAGNNGPQTSQVRCRVHDALYPSPVPHLCPISSGVVSLASAAAMPRVQISHHASTTSWSASKKDPLLIRSSVQARQHGLGNRRLPRQENVPLVRPHPQTTAVRRGRAPHQVSGADAQLDHSAVRLRPTHRILSLQQNYPPASPCHLDVAAAFARRRPPKSTSPRRAAAEQHGDPTRGAPAVTRRQGPRPPAGLSLAPGL